MYGINYCKTLFAELRQCENLSGSLVIHRWQHPFSPIFSSHTTRRNNLAAYLFFTLVGAYKYGWKVGLLTAVLSPIINSLLFGMPISALLPAILLKSVLLAIAAGWAAQRFGRISIPVLVGVVLTYQVVGTLGEWMYIGNFYNAIQDFRIGIPGMCLQVFGGYLFIRYLIRK